VNYRKLSEEIAEIPEVAPIAKWSSGELSETEQVKEYDLGPAISKPGPYALVFQYRSGGHRLDIDRCEIWHDQIKVYESKLAGRTGHFDSHNRHRFEVSAGGGRWILKAWLKTSGGTDSNGEIFVFPITE
jgi:hypothetical protein